MNIEQFLSMCKPFAADIPTSAVNGGSEPVTLPQQDGSSSRGQPLYNIDQTNITYLYDDAEFLPNTMQRENYDNSDYTMLDS
jgi:hypothetical protein